MEDERQTLPTWRTQVPLCVTKIEFCQDWRTQDPLFELNHSVRALKSENSGSGVLQPSISH